MAKKKASPAKGQDLAESVRRQWLKSLVNNRNPGSRTSPESSDILGFQDSTYTKVSQKLDAKHHSNHH